MDDTGMLIIGEGGTVLSKVENLSLVPVIEVPDEVEKVVGSLTTEASFTISNSEINLALICNTIAGEYYKKFDKHCSRCSYAAECIKNKINKRLKGE